MRKILIPAISILLLAACSQKEVKTTEAGEETAAEIEVAQMMGRDAARDFAVKKWDDTLALQDELLNVRAVQSKYVIDGKPQSAAAFDSAFISTMRTVRPELADHLDRHYKK